MIIDTNGKYNLPTSPRYSYEDGLVRLRTCYDRQMITGDVLAIPIGVVMVDLDGQQYTDCFPLKPHDRFGSYYGTHTADIDHVLAFFKSIGAMIQLTIDFGMQLDGTDLDRHVWHTLIHERVAPLFNQFREQNFARFMDTKSEYSE